MALTLQQIRAAVYERADWSPGNATSATNAMRGFINSALRRLASDAPFLYAAERREIELEPDVVGGDNDTFSVDPTDAWVLVSDNVAAAMDISFEADRPWDGRALFVRTSATAPWEEYRIREAWLSIADSKIRMTLDRPWPNVTDTGLMIRVHTSEYVLPPDVVEVRSMRIWGESFEVPVRSTREAERVCADLGDFDNAGAAMPLLAYRTAVRGLPAPKQAPDATFVPAGESDPWNTDEPAATRTFVYTFVWGLHSNRHVFPGPATQASGSLDASRVVPYLESVPSPQSIPVTMAEASGSISLALPNVDYEHGFFESGATRYTRAGIRKRIYMRTTESADITKRSSDETFYLVAEVDGHEVTYTYTGTDLPDVMTPAPVHARYRTLRMWPTPDQNYRAQLRVVILPKELIDDQDVAEVDEEARDMVVSLVLYHLRGMSGSDAAANAAMRDYLNALNTFKRRYGSSRASEVPLRRQPAGRGIRRARLGRLPR